MVASPEINRQNSLKSTGPRSARGKAIASSNSTKHGMLSSQPPLIMGEDLASFEGIMQSLIDEHQPVGATEHLLVQQLGMSYLRLYRLWGAEAAIARSAQLQIERKAITPIVKSTEDLLLGGQDTPEKLLQLEQDCLKALVNGIEDEISWLIPKRITKKWAASDKATELLNKLLKLLQDAISSYPHALAPNLKDVKRGLDREHVWTKLLYWQASAESPILKPGYSLEYLLETISEKAQNRIAAIDNLLASLTRIDAESHQAAIAIHAIPQEADRLAKYERAIMRSMGDALDRLAALQERRSAASMGSFGQN